MTGGSGEALAGTVCGTTPTVIPISDPPPDPLPDPPETDRIKCDKSNQNVAIFVDGLTYPISTTGDTEPGIHAKLSASANNNITIGVTGVEGTNTITTAGRSSYGIWTQINGPTGGPNTTTITLEDVTIKTTGTSTSGVGANGVRAWHTATGDLTIDATDSSITSTGFGIYGRISNTHVGNIDIDLDNTDITTTATDDTNSGVVAHYSGGDNNKMDDDNDIDIDITDGRFTTKGTISHGVFGWHQNDGNIEITTTDLDITTEGTGLTSSGVTASHGIYALHQSEGDIKIDVKSGSIMTAGTNSYGLYGLQTKAGGTIDIDTSNDHSITTTGPNGHGIVTYQLSTTADLRTIDISVGGPIAVSGGGARGVQVGAVIDDVPQRMATLDDDGYRRQKVTVNGRISSTGEGIYLTNGGRVIIRAGGSIASESGIAILATGTVPGDTANMIAAIPPKLRVDLNPGDDRMMGESGWLATALGGGWIINDGGETTITVNGVVLHDGETGVTGKMAPNGAWNVRMKANGVMVTDRTTDSDPANWVVSDQPEGVFADRDFAAKDFSEISPPPPPSPPPAPPAPDPPPVDAAKLEELVEGAVAHALGSIVLAPLGERETPASPFVEEYAPRAAVYEALPAALLGLNDVGQETGTPPSHGSFSFAHTFEGRRGFSPAGSTVGQSHGFGYSGAQFGWTMELSETLSTSAALHRVRGAVSVDAGTGGGKIGVEATGLVLDAAWQGRDGFYARAGLSTTHYEIDAKSEDRAVGMLTGDVEARGSQVRVETGREIALSGGPDVAPRLWLKRSALSVDDFTDAVGSRVSFLNTARITSGVGMTARAERRSGIGSLALQGSVDLAHLLGGAVTVTDVSGTRLASKAEDTDLRLALAGVYRYGGLLLAAEASMNGSHLDAATGAVGMRLSLQF